MSGRDGLAPLLESPGRWTWAYVDGHGDAPQPAEHSKRRSIVDRLRDTGAPDADVDAIDAALEDGEGVPSPSSRYLLARDGAVELDERFVGVRLGPELLGHGPVPPVLPLLRHRAADLRYLVVETGREGASLRLVRSQRVGVEGAAAIEGRTDSLPKVQAGGWSHRRYQMHSEDIWKHNQSDVADAVDQLVREHRPRFVVVAGDIRARQLLLDELAPASRELVIDVDAHTRADGADDEALRRAVAEAVEQHVEAEVAGALDRAAANDGELGAQGLDDVVAALQEAKVDTLLLDARFLDAEQTLIALDGAPWVARSQDDALGAGVVAALPLHEALARAAILSGASVLVLEEPEAPADAPRSNRETRPPIALLRWADQGDAGS